MFLIENIPKNINESFFHKYLLTLLESMSKDDSVPHMLFYGPRGSGKKTLIRLFLEMLFGPGINDVKNDVYEIPSSGNKIVPINIKKSDFHIIINPTNTNFDKYLVHCVVNNYTKKVLIPTYNHERKLKIILINNVDNMPEFAQTSLRRTMEIYSKSCRFIMWCHKISRVIEPLRSRCLCLKVPSPLNSELYSYVNTVCINEKIFLTLEQMDRILNKANGNIKIALWCLQLLKLGYSDVIIYEELIDKIVSIIISCNTNEINKIRELLYHMMITNINGTQIMTDIVIKLDESDKISDKAKYYIRELATRFEYNLVRGRREIIHHEAFILETMAMLYKFN